MTSDPAKLEALVGAPRRAEPSVEGGRDIVRLVAMVDSAAVNSSPTLASSFVKAASPTKSRGYRRIDWLNMGAAAIAIVVAVGAATFTGVQVASASPTAGAVQVLETDESALAGAEQGIVASKTRLQEAVQTATTDAATLRTALGTLAESESRSVAADPTALATAIQAVDTYQTALASIALPELPTPYERGSVDEKSLESVGDAINRVQEASAATDALAEELRAVRANVDTQTAEYTAKLGEFAASFTTHAQTETEQYPVAEQEFRDAVITAAATITASPLDTPAGATALAAYRDAVYALRDDDYRARVEEEAERNNQNQNNTWQPSPTPTEEPTDPGASNSGTTNPVPTPPAEDSGDLLDG